MLKNPQNLEALKLVYTIFADSNWILSSKSSKKTINYRQIFEPLKGFVCFVKRKLKKCVFFVAFFVDAENLLDYND